MYGEHSGAIRAELSTLLRQHRFQRRIGGAGVHTAPVSTTVAQREEIGRLIQRYRFGLLTWCRQALDSAGASRTETGGWPVGPEVDLRRRLLRTIEASPAGPPSMDDLTTPHEFPLVDAWRLASRAAVLGEHDLAGELDDGRLDNDQRLTLLKDAAEIIRALTVLDRRYANVPGWELLNGGATLQRIAEACAFIEAADYSIDRRGWRPPALTIDGPPHAGIGGVVQALHNLRIHLTRFPKAMNFRRILDSQRELSTVLATRLSAADPALAAPWSRRASTYAALHREARNMGGQIGAGGVAVAEAANAISRLRKVPRTKPVSERALRDLTLLCNAVDEQMADLFEQGARERLYFVRTKVPRIVGNDGAMTHRVRERFMPITSPIQTDLIRLVGEQLRPPLTAAPPPPGARASRLELRDAITHRCQTGPGELGL